MHVPLLFAHLLSLQCYICIVLKMPQLLDITMICSSLCKEGFHDDVSPTRLGSRRKQDDPVLFVFNNCFFDIYEHLYMLSVAGFGSHEF